MHHCWVGDLRLVPHRSGGNKKYRIADAECRGNLINHSLAPIQDVQYNAFWPAGVIAGLTIINLSCHGVCCSVQAVAGRPNACKKLVLSAQPTDKPNNVA
jgi:hypothetical protein